jgi:hypothetical protein
LTGAKEVSEGQDETSVASGALPSEEDIARTILTESKRQNGCSAPERDDKSYRSVVFLGSDILSGKGWISTQAYSLDHVPQKSKLALWPPTQKGKVKR